MPTSSNEDKYKQHKDDDEDDLEALRMAALMTIGKKQSQPPPVPNVIFKPHLVNPNLIAIIPEGAEHKPMVHKPLPRQPFFRHPPMRNHPPMYRPQISSTLKQIPQVQIKVEQGTAPTEKKEDSEKEEVSTKFSRFEDIESESEDESETEKKESESSDESDDVLALEDDDDSLEALMAQMEHEIEVGIDPEPSKKDKKKGKNTKAKEKEAKTERRLEDKNRLEEKINLEKAKVETKTAVVEPTFKESSESKSVKCEIIKDQRSPSPLLTKTMPPVKVHPLTNKATEDNSSLNRITVDRKSISPIKERSQSPHKQNFHNSPHKTDRVAVTSKSPIERRSQSPRRSQRSKSPFSRVPLSPTRRKSPMRKTSLERRSPLRRSLDRDRYYSRNKSPSPYYKSRERDSMPLHRSRSPVRRRSLSPRKDVRNPSPRYYRRKSRSPWSPVRRPASPIRSPSPRYRSRSPLHRHSLSPRNKKYTKSVYQHSPPFWGSPKRRSPSQSPRRSKSPRKREYSPRRDYSYRRNSLSPKRKSSPHYKKYSPPTPRSPKQKPRSPSPKRNVSPKRKISPVLVKETRPQVNRKSRTPSLSLSPSPSREAKEPARRHKSPLRPRKESNENVTSRTSRARRGNSPDNRHSDGDARERRKPSNKVWEKEGRQWDRKADDKRKDRTEKMSRESKRDKETNRTEKQKQEEPKDEPVSLKVTNNPVFEARRKKFESTVVVEPAGKKIRLVSKKSSPVEEKIKIEDKCVPVIEEKKNVDNRECSAQTEDDLFSGREEIDEIDNFLNEDVLDLSAEVWSSDDEIFSKVNKAKPKISKKSPVKQAVVKERISLKEKAEVKKSISTVNTSPVEVKKRKSASPLISKKSPEPEVEKDNSDLRAALRRRREERLTKAGSLHEKLPKRLLQSAFESALGTKKPKKEEKSQKSSKVSKSKEAPPTSPVHRERTDQRICIKCCFNVSNSCTVTIEMIQKASGDKNMETTQIKGRQIKNGRIFVDSYPSSGRPSLTTPENIQRVVQSNGDYFEGCHGLDDNEQHQCKDMIAGRILFKQTIQGVLKKGAHKSGRDSSHQNKKKGLINIGPKMLSYQVIQGERFRLNFSSPAATKPYGYFLAVN
ncbi:hypothetical protein J6590_062065 [Homalodisca vitripennis]|nr:hypothetical protein J6590_062065 [Homalodisca vitripennis]